MKNEKGEEVAEVVVKTPQGDEKAPEQTPTGRTAILEAYRASNPDTGDEVDDEALFGFANDRYNQQAGANARLAERVSKDPRLGAALSMMVGEGRSMPYAMGSTFGRDWLDGDLEEFEAGYQENLKRLAESNAQQEAAAKNIQEYQANLEKFANDNGLDEAGVASLNDAIYADAENFLMGIIPLEYIDYKWKGMNYDKDVDEAASTGYVEGKNEAIDMKKKKATGAPLPDLTGGSGAGKPRPAPQQPKRRDFFEPFDQTNS